MVELVMVLLIMSTLSAFAMPVVSSSLKQYRLRSGVASMTWAIQSTRFQALMAGYPFQVTFQGDASGNSPSYQIASKPTGAASYSNVGSSVPVSGSIMTLSAATIVQFQPNGTVTMTAGGATVSTLQLSYSGYSNTITVSNYGNLAVTTP